MLLVAQCQRVTGAHDERVIRADPVELGVVSEGRWSFRFDIPVAEDASVVSVRTSCPCLSVLEYSSTLSRGGDLVVRGTLDTHGLSGAVTQRVQIATEPSALYLGEVRAWVQLRAFASVSVIDAMMAESSGAFVGTTEVVVPNADRKTGVSIAENASGLKVVVSPVTHHEGGDARAEVSIAGRLHPDTDWAAYSVVLDVDRGDRTEYVPLRVVAARPPGLVLTPPMLVFEDHEEGALTGTAAVKAPPGSSLSELEVWTEPRTGGVVELDAGTGQLIVRAKSSLLPLTVFVADGESWAELFVCTK